MSTDLTPWTDWDAKMAFADQLVKTGFLPTAIKTAGQALAIIFAGQEIGIPPMHALRSIDIIQGKPRISSELSLSLFKQRGGRAVWRQSDEKIAELWLRHPNGDEHIETFTLEDAKRAGLVGKDNWRMYPKSMLRARCVTAGLRAVAPDITAGTYDPDEVVEATGVVIDAPKPAANKLDALTERLKSTEETTVPDLQAAEYKQRLKALNQAHAVATSAAAKASRTETPPSEQDYQASLLAVDGPAAQTPHPDR